MGDILRAMFFKESLTVEDVGEDDIFAVGVDVTRPVWHCQTRSAEFVKVLIVGKASGLDCVEVEGPDYEGWSEGDR